MSGVLSPLGGAGWQFFNTTGGVLNGGFLYTYAAGTTTPLATYTDSTLGTPNTNPVVMSASGRPMNPSNGVGEIWLSNNTAYKFVLTDANNVVQGTYDNVTGINSSTTVVSEWVSNNLVPTYISATQFSVPGNQTSLFTVNRRVQFSINAGTYYGYVSASSYSNPNTTVTIVADSTGLDASLSAVNYGILNPTNPSVPQNYAQAGTAVTFTTIGGTVITASGQFTGPGTGLTGTAAALSIGGSAASATTAGSATTATTATNLSGGTVAATTISASGLVTPSTTVGIKGTAAADSAQAGSVGEYLTASSAGTTVAVNGTAVTLQTISLTAGDWDVWGVVSLAGSTMTFVQACISLSASFPGYANSTNWAGINSSTSQGVPTPMVRVNISTTTTVYLLGAIVGGGTAANGSYGTINARRVR